MGFHAEHRHMVNCPWSEFEKDPFPFCEEQICHIIGQPANTWSNIGYFIIAWLIWRNRHLTSAKFTFFGVALFLAIGSTLFHMSGAMWAKILDVSAMLLLSGLCLTLSLQKNFSWKARTQLVTFLILSALSYPLVGKGKLGGYLFLAEIILTVGLELRMRASMTAQSWRYLKNVLITFPVALALNMMDQHGPLCWPTNHIFTVHGLWHLMTAFCIYRITQYYCEMK